MPSIVTRPIAPALILIVVVMILASFGGNAYAIDAKAQIEQRERECDTAAAAGTVDQAMECFDTSDNDIVAYDVFTPLQYKGPVAIRGYFEKYFALGLRNTKIDFIDLQVFTDGRLGFTYSAQRFTATDRDGHSINTIFRQSDVWRRHNGKWKIILTHASFPVDPVTLKADLQSKP
jgi:ketosteroid isomerase-like protein